MKLTAGMLVAIFAVSVLTGGFFVALVLTGLAGFGMLSAANVGYTRRELGGYGKRKSLH